MTGLFRKLYRQLTEEGVRSTARAVAGFGRRQVGATLAGTPGYYRLQRWRLARRYGDASAITPVWVDTERITELSGGYERRTDGHLDHYPQFCPREARWELPCEATVPYGTRRGGDWDRERAPLSRLLLYRGAHERLQEGRNWTETDYYRELVGMFGEDGWSQTEARTLAEQRCTDIDELAATIEQEEYRSQRQLGGHPLDEVTVNVSREGDLLYNSDGRHRLCVAAALGVERIPVLVLVRHADHTGERPE